MFCEVFFVSKRHRANSTIQFNGSKTDYEYRLTFYIAYVKIAPLYNYKNLFQYLNFSETAGAFYMKVVGIIAEYNPFHRGHEYQIRYAREVLGADYVVVAMSGDFVQRGAPALMEKHLRAEMALLGGADLVLEMPVQTATASAEGFAAGGVSLLDNLGIIDELCFGSECGDTDILTEAARILIKEPPAYRELLQQNLRLGMSFPLARSRALTDFLTRSGSSEMSVQDGHFISPDQTASVLSSPNNILGIEYCKALFRQNSSIQPHAVLRKGSGYHETDFSGVSEDFFPSASGIRRLLADNGNKADFSGLLPDAVFPVFSAPLEKGRWILESALDLPLHYKLLLETEESLHMYSDLSNALIRRILKSRNRYEGFSQFADLLKTRDITRSAICRGLVRIFLDLKEKAPGHIPYARVLGFRKNSAPLLSQIKKNASVPMITKTADASSILDKDGLQIFNKTCEASNLYEMLLCRKTGQPFVHEFQKSPRIIS